MAKPVKKKTNPKSKLPSIKPPKVTGKNPASVLHGVNIFVAQNVKKAAKKAKKAKAATSVSHPKRPIVKTIAKKAKKEAVVQPKAEEPVLTTKPVEPVNCEITKKFEEAASVGSRSTTFQVASAATAAAAAYTAKKAISSYQSQPYDLSVGVSDMLSLMPWVISQHSNALVPFHSTASSPLPLAGQTLPSIGMHTSKINARWLLFGSVVAGIGVMAVGQLLMHSAEWSSNRLADMAYASDQGAKIAEAVVMPAASQQSLAESVKPNVENIVSEAKAPVQTSKPSRLFWFGLSFVGVGAVSLLVWRAMQNAKSASPVSENTADSLQERSASENSGSPVPGNGSFFMVPRDGDEQLPEQNDTATSSTFPN